MSDAECEEGALWKAVMFAPRHRLANLVAIIDLGGQQALGYTEDVLSLTPMADRWRAFGWNACEVDGHDAAALTRALGGLDPARSGPPHVVVAHTVSGGASPNGAAGQMALLAHVGRRVPPGAQGAAGRLACGRPSFARDRDRGRTRTIARMSASLKP